MTSASWRVGAVDRLKPAPALRPVRPRVAIISSSFWPEQTGVAQTVTEFAMYLARHGFQTEVVTAMPFYPGWSIWPDYRGRLHLTETHEGLTISRSWHFVRPQLGTMVRLLHELTLCGTAAGKMVSAIRRADVAYIVSPPLSVAFLAIHVAKIFRVPRILCVKDVLPDAAIELGMLKNRTMIAVSRWLARRAYALADEVHTLGEGMRRRIMREARSPEKIRVVSDTIDAHELAPVPFAENEFRRRFVPDGVFAVVHTGNMGKKQDLDILIRAAARLREEPAIHFYVFGDGAVKQEFLGRRDALKLSNISLHPLQERWMVPHVLSGADVLLVSQLAEVVDIAVPSKLLTALGAGAMILAACARDSETARIVEESHGGIVVPAGDDDVLAREIERVRAGAINISGFRARAREYAVRVFDRDAVYGPVLDSITRMASPRRADPGYGPSDGDVPDGDLIRESYER